MTRHRPAVWVLLVVAVAMAIATWVLVGLSWGDPVAEAYYWRSLTVVNVVVFLLFALVGALIIRRRPGHLVGWLLAGIGLGMLIIGWGIEYAIYGLLVAPGGLPGVAGVAIIGNVLWIIPFGLLPILLLVYPSGQFVSRRWKLAVIPALLAMAAVVSSAIPTWRYRDQANAVLLDQGVGEDETLVISLVAGGLILLLVSLIVGVGSLAMRWRASGRVERLQIRWLLFASGAWVTLAIAVNLLLLVGGPLATAIDTSFFAELLNLIGIGAIPAAVGVAILRYRLYEIDRIVSRTVTYGLVTAVLIGLYALVAVVPAALFDLDSDLLVAGATLVAAAAFGPVRRHVQALVNRRFNRQQYDAAHVAEGFATRLRDEVDLAELTGDLQRTVATTVQPAHMSLWLPQLKRS